MLEQLCPLPHSSSPASSSSLPVGPRPGSAGLGRRRISGMRGCRRQVSHDNKPAGRVARPEMGCRSTAALHVPRWRWTKMWTTLSTTQRMRCAGRQAAAADGAEASSGAAQRLMLAPCRQQQLGPWQTTLWLTCSHMPRPGRSVSVASAAAPARRRGRPCVPSAGPRRRRRQQRQRRRRKRRAARASASGGLAGSQLAGCPARAQHPSEFAGKRPQGQVGALPLAASLQTLAPRGTR